jgi:hypothetical protein
MDFQSNTERRVGLLAKLGATLPDGYHEVVGESEAVRRVLAHNPMALAPCNCDPLCENFLDDGVRMWIVDWEYSGMNDPIWDLGGLSVEAGFDGDQDRLQGHVRPAVDPLGADPARQRQSGGGLLGLRGRPARLAHYPLTRNRAGAV